MLIRLHIVLTPLLLWNAIHAQPPKDNLLIFADNFEQGFDTAHWIAEKAGDPDSKVYVQKGKLVLDTRGGVTVWFKQKLSGKIQISYTRTVIQGDGTNDRVSDLNQFWMAEDPWRPHLFTRSGVLETYDSLRMYYVGMGGNTNTTTRFRKYEGNGNRTLLGEFTDSAHLLQPNVPYHITIKLDDHSTSFWVNGLCYFTSTDPKLLKQGYFAFRSTWSHQEIDDFRVYRLPGKALKR